jgi:PAS domain S-box-containing protein
MRISQKLILGFIGIALLVAAVGALAIKHNTEIVMDVDQILLANSKEAKAASEIAYQIQRIHSSMSELLLETAVQTPARRKYAKKTIADSISKLQQFNLLWEDAIKLGIELSKDKRRGENELEAFKSLKTKINSFVNLVNETVEVRETKGQEEAELLYESEVEPLFLETQKITKALEERTRKGVMTETEQIRSEVNHSTWFSIVATVVGLLAVITVRHYVIKTISSPITKLMDATARIGKGELETTIEIGSDDEIGALAKSFNDMTKKLRESYAAIGEEMQQRTEELSTTTLTLEEEIAHRSSAQKALERHVKHLDCLYQLSKLIERPRISLEQIFQETAPLIRKAFYHPDVTCVRITYNGIPYQTDNFEKSELSEYAEIRVHGDKAGAIEAYNLAERPKPGENVLKEERDLLNAVAEHLGRIAGRRQTAEKLKLFRDLIDRSNDCIFVMEPQWGRFLDANNRACSSLGYTRKELLNLSFKDIERTMPDDSSWRRQTKELNLKGDIVIQGRHKRKDETTFLVETSLKLVSQKNENYIIAVARDVTERKQAEERQAKLIKELKCTNQKVKSINQELKDFAYIISHDLKAPLRGIKTLADWIASDYVDKLDDNGKDQMNLLLARVGRMHSLIEGVLQYSRVGRIKEENVKVNLNELMPEVIDMVAPPDNVTVTIAGELPVIECGRTSIMQVFQNLLSNAVKYMDKPRGRVTIGCDEEDGFWKFSVTDNGPGIEEKHFERIFRIFQTLTPRDEFESTGIGLTVIKKIVELYGGKIWVESEVGKGSTFLFTWPKSKKELKNAEVEANTAC